MALPDFDNEVPSVSAHTATNYVREMVKLETVTSGTNESAIHKLARDYGLTVSQLVHLYKGKAKTCDVSLFARVRLAYLDRCARMAAAMQHRIAMEEALSGNADDQDLVDRLGSIAAEIAAKASALRAREKVK